MVHIVVRQIHVNLSHLLEIEAVVLVECVSLHDIGLVFLQKPL